jgi:hypothetical protein
MRFPTVSFSYKYLDTFLSFAISDLNILISIILIIYDLLILRTPRWYLYLIVVVGFECSWDPESYAGGSVATGRSTQAGQVEG